MKRNIVNVNAAGENWTADMYGMRVMIIKWTCSPTDHVFVEEAFLEFDEIV